MSESMTSQERWELELIGKVEDFDCARCRRRPAAFGYETCARCRAYVDKYQRAKAAAKNGTSTASSGEVEV